jgi:hypothetical protein
MTEFGRKSSLKAALLGGVAVLALTVSPVMSDAVSTAAFADEGGTHGQGGQGARGQGGQGSGGQGSGGQGDARGKAGRSLDAIFRDVTGSDEGGKGGMGGGRPDQAGSKRGDDFGDLWIVLRDDNGVPILSAAGFVQPLDADGDLIPLDEEGHPVDESLTQEVELGRLNVGRAPTSVLDRRAEEVIVLLNSATAVSVDAAGRLVLTVDGEDKTIDSPLENLAIYVALMTSGTIPGVDDLPGTDFDFLVDGVFTAADLAMTDSFLAAATDKTGVFTTDEIAYINAFLDINTVTTGTTTYSVIDYSGFTYDRSDTYGAITAEVLVQESDGTWVVETVNIYDEVFGGDDYTASGTLSAYTQSADDARAVINFIHEYEVPVDDISESEH